MRIKTNWPAEPGHPFAPTAFADQIGKTTRFTMPGRAAAECTIVAVKVAADGTSAELELDVPDEAEGVLGGRGHYSIGRPVASRSDPRFDPDRLPSGVDAP